MQKEIEKFIAYLKVERHYALLGMIFWDNK
jgi:hypothetical protein